MVVAALFPALLCFSRFTWERRAVTAISATVFVAGNGSGHREDIFAQSLSQLQWPPHHNGTPTI